jgi:hypothetical protein
MLSKICLSFVAITMIAGCGSHHTSTSDSVPLQSVSKSESVSANPDFEGVWASGCIDYWNGSYSIKTEFRGSRYIQESKFFDFSGCKALREKVSGSWKAFEVIGVYTPMDNAWNLAWHHSPTSYGILVLENHEIKVAQARTFDINNPGSTSLLKLSRVSE